VRMNMKRSAAGMRDATNASDGGNNDAAPQ
jgi:hypothetical protein